MTRRLHSMLLVAVLTSTTQATLASSPSSATEEERSAAQKMFEAGDGLYESGRFEDAVGAFRNSHQLVASPNSRLMLARSLREAGHNEDACREFRGTIEDADASGGRYPEALQAAQSELRALEELIAGMKASTTATTPQASSRSTEATASERSGPVAEAPTPVAKPEASSGSRTLRLAAWSSVGVGVVGLSAFGVFGYLDRKTYQQLDSRCSNNLCPASSSNEIDLGRRYQLLANVGLGAAAVGALAATTLFVLNARYSSDAPRVAVQVSPSTLLINGEF